MVGCAVRHMKGWGVRQTRPVMGWGVRHMKGWGVRQTRPVMGWGVRHMKGWGVRHVVGLVVRPLMGYAMV